MKRIVVVLTASLLLFGGTVFACVGKTLYIGSSAAPEELVLAEMLAVLVTERTGTTVKILQFRSRQEMYGAVRKGEVGLLVETPQAAVAAAGKSLKGEALRTEFRRSMNLVWLEPFGDAAAHAPVASADVLTNFPALPKLLAKLSGAINDDAYEKLVKAARGAEKPRKLARDFLKAKRLI